MLVLSRRLGEEVHIGDDIRIVISRVCGNQVRLGIEAPTHTPISRPKTEHRRPRASARNYSTKELSDI